jgi:two-component system chemotaxis sensor kinase CheA
MDELLQQFIVEARELVEQATDDLLALDRAPDDAARIASAFRALHTLKGSVGLFDFAPLGVLLHAAEDLMGALRDGRMPPDGGAIDALLDAIGAIDAWIGAIARTASLPAEAEAGSRRLTAAMQALLAAPGEAAPPPLETLPDWLPATLARDPEAVSAALAGLGASGGSLTAMRYLPDPDCFFRGDDPLAIVRAIPELRLLHVAPRTPWPAGSIDPFRCNLVIELLSAAPAAAIDQAVRFVRDQVELAPVGPPAAVASGPAAAAGGEPAPAARSLRVDAARVDALADLVGELIVAKNRLGHLAAEAARVSPELARALAANQATIARLVGTLHAGVTGLRSVPLAQTFRRLPRLVREVAGRLGKPARLEMQGGETDADKAIVDALYEPLLHVLRNALDHGIEDAASRAEAGKPAVGLIDLRAAREGDQVVVTVTDDGGGIDPAALRRTARRKAVLPDATIDAMDDAAALELIFAPGFSTAASVTDVSGRGVGLDAVRRSIAALGGSVGIASTSGRGTTLRLAVPLAVAVTTVIVVRVGAERFGVPLEAVVETARVARERVVPVRDGAAFVLRERTIPLLRLADLLDCPGSGVAGEDAKVLVIASGEQQIGVAVDGFGERIDVVLRPLSGLLSGLRGAHGTALLGDGSVLLVLDLAELAG